MTLLTLTLRWRVMDGADGRCVVGGNGGGQRSVWASRSVVRSSSSWASCSSSTDRCSLLEMYGRHPLCSFTSLCASFTDHGGGGWQVLFVAGITLLIGLQRAVVRRSLLLRLRGVPLTRVCMVAFSCDE